MGYYTAIKMYRYMHVCVYTHIKIWNNLEKWLGITLSRKIYKTSSL